MVISASAWPCTAPSAMRGIVGTAAASVRILEEAAGAQGRIGCAAGCTDGCAPLTNIWGRSLRPRRLPMFSQYPQRYRTKLCELKLSQRLLRSAWPSKHIFSQWQAACSTHEWIGHLRGDQVRTGRKLTTLAGEGGCADGWPILAGVIS